MYSSKQHDDKSHTSPALTPTIEDTSIIDDTDVFSGVDVSTMVDVDEVAARKPHFLDYDAVPPPEFENDFDNSPSKNIRVTNFVIAEVQNYACGGLTGEQLKVDKKFERDGEISDYELAASGYTKKEFTQDDNTLHIVTRPGSLNRLSEHRETITPFEKSKHFLDENPIPPDYMLDHELREHRSLDRNFERHNEHRNRSPSKERKCSLDRVSRSSREKIKEPFYTLSRFLDHEGEVNPIASTLDAPLPKGEAWTLSYESRFGCSQIAPLRPSIVGEVDTLGPKVECVYSLLSMLGSNDTLEMSKKFLELSRTPEACAALRRSGCIPLLVQIMNADGEKSVRKCASMALHNVVHSHTDEKAGRREAKVLRLLDQLVDYCNFLKTLLQSGGEAIADDSDRHPLAAISSLMKVSFDEEHRHAMCELGALQVIPSLVHLDHAVHGPRPEEQCCNSLRRYALMALTNLTFGDENNKALLCSQKVFMEALVVQLECAPDDLLQVTASVLRNLSWRADNNMKAVLNEIGTVTALAQAAMKNKSENTLKAILSALWNLSAHCSTNKAEFCSVDGALAFLVDMLTYEGPSKTLKIIENAGGILRNVSSHIAVCGHYREILRERNCLAILLQQLKSESLTVVSNSCGTLWNLSARCPVDQKYLWDNGAVPMLRSLIHSKHAMISEGSSSALKNLLNFRPSIQNQTQMDHTARSMGLKKLPTLNARKQKALEQELGAKEHSETCDNLDVGTRLTNECANFENNLNLKRMCTPLGRTIGVAVSGKQSPTAHFSRSAVLSKSESRDSVFSAKSDSVYENFVRSHSKSDENRKPQHLKYAVDAKGVVFGLEHDTEHTEEQPIDYSMQFDENRTKSPYKSSEKSDPETVEAAGSSNYATYQETDIDQPTDFSLRYAENQLESDVDISPVDITPAGCGSDVKTTEDPIKQVNSGNEILLILEDSVKCYQTEDTPYVISNAASVTDLHQNKTFNAASEHVKANTVAPSKKLKKISQPAPASNFGFGAYTPEKPTNYCEEGTPGYFSRYESLSSLNESPPQGTKTPSESTIQQEVDVNDYKKNESVSIITKITPSGETIDLTAEKEVTTQILTKSTEAATLNVNLNSAQETPLMFSRHSSMDSLAEEDVCPCDDKSSVVSDFSRLASGVISPSEIPDSPTQSMPQSPKRRSASLQVSSGSGLSTTILNTVPRTYEFKQPRLRSVFEDGLNTFDVENTPAQFSCATSLSNLSLLDDENIMNTSQHLNAKTSSSNATTSTVENAPLKSIVISEGEEESETNNDDILLANCINIGMSRSTTSPMDKIKSNPKSAAADLRSKLMVSAEVPTQYYTEDTPAILSKVGSNTNLSTISINSNMRNNDDLEGTCPEVEKRHDSNRHSLNLSDEVSSNASESGGINILQQCIRDGMKKTATTSAKNDADPIEMMRSGGNVLPTYLPVSDEMSNFLVEDTPCNFSVVSALSNLTVGSSLVGPAIQMGEKATSIIDTASGEEAVANNKKSPINIFSKDNVGLGHADDSLSSLSIDSEDDTNLLSQAIAAGCNRPKSNLGFSSSSINSKRLNSLSISQPLSINSAPSTSSLTSTAPSRNHYRRQHSQVNNNDSFSSVDSSDSNDNQSKSLFELCILTGMNKRHHSTGHHYKRGDQTSISSKNEASTSTSKEHSKNVDLWSNSSQMPPQRHVPTFYRIQHERERKDKQLLMECINTGISKKIGAVIGAPNENVGSLQPAKQHETLAHSNVPKNVKATSAAALEPYRQKAVTTFQSAPSTAAPGVGMNIVNRTDAIKRNKDVNTDDKESLQRAQQQIQTAIISQDIQAPETGQRSRTDTGCKHSRYLDELRSCSSESFIIETVLPLENAQQNVSTAVNKHKDPDLMLQSVERLTQEFVASAEQLRTNGSSDSSEQHKNSVKHSLVDTVSSASNNTWNEDTCPNDVSFPSVSITAPSFRLSNFNDYGEDEPDDESTDADHKELHDFAEITPTNELQPEASLELTCADLELYQQPNSIDTDTETLVSRNYSDTCDPKLETVGGAGATASNGIHFILGGEVQNASAAHPLHLFNCSMNNSTIIAMEARNLADNFLQNVDDGTELTYSLNSLDLENVRPPSGMESLNISGYFEESSKLNIFCTQPNSQQRTYKPQSPNMATKSPKFPRKSLPTGLVARRALGQLPGVFSGSTESVNSSCLLLDNIKPPSLMDELLDSMISVASIQSEVADCDSLATTVSVSNYETAAVGNELDDNTVTLQSCYDASLPNDKDDDASINSGTLLPSDYEYSSAESTPRKSTDSTHGVKRTLTPKQKRKLAKDRFKTYTIVSDVVLDNMQQQFNFQARDYHTEDENIQIEIEEHVLPVPDLSADQQNVTLSLNTQSFVMSQRKESTQLDKVTNISSTSSNDIASAADNNSIEYDQNSETESCHELADDANKEFYTTAAADIKRSNQIARPRIAKPGDADYKTNEDAQSEQRNAIRGRIKPAYISPYKMQYQRSTPARKPSKNVASLTPTSYAFRKINTNSNAASVTPSQRKPSEASPIKRQGTFVKEEPTITNALVPVVDTVLAQVNSPSRISKLPTKKESPVPKSASKSAPHLRSSVTAVTNPKYNPIRKTATPQRSNSNASIKVTSSVARSAVLASRISTTTPPSRSNSNLNGCSLATAHTPTFAAKINQAQSRIAGIWKRVDEAKKNQLSTIKTASNSNLTSASNSAQKKSMRPSSTAVSKQKFLRSSTFDTTAEHSDKTAKPHKIQSNLNIESKSTQSKIAVVNKAKFYVARKENMASRKK